MTKTESLGNKIKDVVMSLISNKASKATLYVSPNETIVATHTLYQGKLPRKNSRGITISVTFGKPNYASQQFIKLAKIAKVSFPIKKIQLKFPKKND